MTSHQGLNLMFRGGFLLSLGDVGAEGGQAMSEKDSGEMMKSHQIPVSIVLAASAFAADKHRDQFRKGADRIPYINHPISVANLLANEAGVTDAPTLAAALLHDTIEDTATTVAELRSTFGELIASIVFEVTDDKSLPKQRRKELQIEHASHLSGQARLIKLADKICNLRDIIRSPPVDWPLERRQEYFDWAKRVVEQMRGFSPRLDELVNAELNLRPHA
jgi:GTP diphosphokinase / guanosine-3',5'-bis(diphosphate) 3'-diphosphatase